MARKIPGKGWFADKTVRLPDGRRHRIRERSPVQTREAAEALEQQRTRELLSPQSPTLAAFSVRFLSEYAATRNKRTEFENKKRHILRHLVPFFGETRLDEITPSMVATFVALKLAEETPKKRKDAPTRHPSRKSVNLYLGTLRRMLTLAREWGVLAVVPRVEPLKLADPRVDYLTFAEARALVDAQPAGMTRALVVVALRTGLRAGELMALRWEHVHAGKLHIREAAALGEVGSPKGGRSRDVPLSQEAREEIESWRRACPARPLVFACVDGRRMMTKSALRHFIFSACVAAGIRKVRPHVLRHTFASHLVMRGVPIAKVQQLLGHTDIRVTMRYAHLAPETDSAVDVLDSRPEGHGNPAATLPWDRGISAEKGLRRLDSNPSRGYVARLRKCATTRQKAAILEVAEGGRKRGN